MSWGLFVSMACALSKPGHRFREAQRLTEDIQPWGALGTPQTLSLATQQGKRTGAELYTLWVPQTNADPQALKHDQSKGEPRLL